MKRREFITLIGGAAVWPLAAQAQKIPRIGVLLVNSAEPMGPFQESLRELGYVEGKTIQLESLSAEGRMARLPELAAALVNSKVDVIVAVLTPAVPPRRTPPATFQLSWDRRAIRSPPVWWQASRAQAATSPVCLPPARRRARRISN